MYRVILIAITFFVCLGQVAIADDREVCRSSSRDDSAISACTRLIATAKLQGHDLATIYYERGLKYRYNGNYNPAIEDFTKAIDIDPKWTWPYVARGHSYASMKDFNRAFADQEYAIKLEPTAVTHVGRAIDLIAAGALDAALKDIDEALRLDPKYFYAHLNRGDIYEKQGALDQALSAYRAALAIKPDDENAAEGIRRVEKRIK